MIILKYIVLAVSLCTCTIAVASEMTTEQRMQKMLKEDRERNAKSKTPTERQWLAPDGKRWTSESAMESHRKTYPNKPYDHAEEQRVWDSFDRKPDSAHSSGGKDTKEYTINTHTTASVIKLMPISTHICALSQVGGQYSRGMKGVDLLVEKRTDGYWYLTATGDRTHNWGKAICWKP